MDIQKSVLFHERTHWTMSRSRDGESGVILERINEHTLPQLICDICFSGVVEVVTDSADSDR
jgi:hypothetical protein